MSDDEPSTDTGQTLDEMNARMIEQFRADGRKMSFGPIQLLLLTTRGAKSGVSRTSPLAAYIEDGRVFVIASYGGAPNHPAWFHNLVAEPSVEVEFDGEVFTAEAHALKISIKCS